jgi:DNA-binding GntR family transcriptional regulator
VSIKTQNRFDPPDVKLLHEKVMSSFFRALINGRIKPLERLTEKTISDELGVSREPVPCFIKK